MIGWSYAGLEWIKVFRFRRRTQKKNMRRETATMVITAGTTLIAIMMPVERVLDFEGRGDVDDESGVSEGLLGGFDVIGVGLGGDEGEPCVGGLPAGFPGAGELGMIPAGVLFAGSSSSDEAVEFFGGPPSVGVGENVVGLEELAGRLSSLDVLSSL